MAKNSKFPGVPSPNVNFYVAKTERDVYFLRREICCMRRR